MRAYFALDASYVIKARSRIQHAFRDGSLTQMRT